MPNYNLGGISYLPEQSTAPVTLNDQSLFSGIQGLDQGLDQANPTNAVSTSRLKTNLRLPISTQDQGIASINEFESPPQGQTQAIYDQAAAQGSQGSRDIENRTQGNLLPNKPNLNIWSELSFFQKMKIRNMPPEQAQRLSEYMYTQRITPLSTIFKERHTKALREADFDTAEALEQEFAPYAAKVRQFGTLLQQQADRRLKVYDQATANHAVADQVLENVAKNDPRHKLALGLKARATEYTPEIFLSMMKELGSNIQTENGVTTVRDASGRLITQYTAPTAVTVEKIPDIERDALTLSGIDVNRIALLRTKIATGQDMKPEEVQELIQADRALRSKNQSGLTLPQRLQATKGSSVSTLLKDNIDQGEIAEFYNPQGNTVQGQQSQSNRNTDKSDRAFKAYAELDAYITKRQGEGATPDQIRNELIAQGKIDNNNKLIIPEDSAKQTRPTQPTTRNQSSASRNRPRTQPSTQAPLNELIGNANKTKIALDEVERYITKRQGEGADEQTIKTELIAQGKIDVNGRLVLPEEQDSQTQFNAQSQPSTSSESTQPAQSQPAQSSSPSLTSNKAITLSPGQTLPGSTTAITPPSELSLPQESMDRLNQTQFNKAAVEAYNKLKESQATAIGQQEQPVSKDSAGAFRLKVDDKGELRLEVSTNITGTQVREQGWVVIKDARFGDLQNILGIQNEIQDLRKAYESSRIPENEKSGFSKSLIQAMATGLNIPKIGNVRLLPPTALSEGHRELLTKAAAIGQRVEKILGNKASAEIGLIKRALTGALSSKTSALSTLQSLDRVLEDIAIGTALIRKPDVQEDDSKPRVVPGSIRRVR